MYSKCTKNANDYRPITICDHHIVDLFIKSVCVRGKMSIANIIFVINIISLVGLGYLFRTNEFFYVNSLINP